MGKYISVFHLNKYRWKFHLMSSKKTPTLKKSSKPSACQLDSKERNKYPRLAAASLLQPSPQAKLIVMLKKLQYSNGEKDANSLINMSKCMRLATNTIKIKLKCISIGLPPTTKACI